MKVTIENHGNRLRLRWRHQGKRYTMAVGVSGNATGQALARQKAAQIEIDISAGYFDKSLLKYKPRILGKTATELSCPELFERYTQFISKDKALHSGSLFRYQGALSHLKKRLDRPAHQVNERIAGNFASSLTEHVSNRTAKEYLWLIMNCWNWAQGKYHVQSENPWAGQVKRIKPQPRQKVKPFTTPEIIAILEAFRNHPKHSHYNDYVAFLFGVGCRPGEASALKWEHLGPEFETAWIGESVSRGKRKSTKTGKSRTVVLSPPIQAMLSQRYQALLPKPDNLIFPSPRGLPICDRNFRERAWKSILEQCNIEYRKPYTTRHTAVSHALANGADPVSVAEQSGHDKRVLLDSYAHVIKPQSVFVEFSD